MPRSNQEVTPTQGARREDGRIIVAAVVAMAAAVVAYFGLGMPGMDHGGEEPNHDVHEPDGRVP